jgi:preprotein translocase subunit SecA
VKAISEIDGFIPGLLAPVRLKEACTCGGDMLYVEHSICEPDEESRRRFAEGGEMPATSYSRRCEACGDERTYTTSKPIFDADDELDDLLREPYVRSEPKIGRNDPCRCGSGKKYKKCCAS